MPQEYDVVDLTSSDDNHEGSASLSPPQRPASVQPTTARRRRRSQAFDEDEDLEGVLTHRPVRRNSEAENNDIEVVSTTHVNVNPLRAAPGAHHFHQTYNLHPFRDASSSQLASSHPYRVATPHGRSSHDGQRRHRHRATTPTMASNFTGWHPTLGWLPVAYDNNPEEDEEDITVEQSAPVTRRNSEDIQVVDHKQITPQERLRQIQESHARGQAVNPRQIHQQQPQPPSRPSFQRANQLSDLLLGRHINVHDIPGGGFNFTPGFPIGNNGGRPSLFSRLGHFGGNHGGNGESGAGINPFGGPSNLEESVLERALRASLDHFSNRKPVDAHSVMKPPEPTPARAGFTRTLEGETELVCVKCQNQLGEVHSASKTDFSRNLSPKVFVRGCGHVYCGVCVHLLKAAKSKERACPVTDCKIPNTKKRGLFREVFL